MTVMLGADAETSNVAELRSLGATFISRYLSDYPSKNLTLSEAQGLTNAGINIVSNWEDDTTNWEGGYARGLQDATRAWSQHKACGGPDKRPIYFSIDMDVDPSNATLHSYFQGLGAGMTPGQIGVYGSTGVCNALKAAGLAPWTWRTMSTGWNGGIGLPAMFNVEQTGGFNSNYDRDASITDDFGQWRIGWTPTVAPTPAPTPAVGVVSLATIQMCARNDPPAKAGLTTNFGEVYLVQRALEAKGDLDPSNKVWGRGAFGTMTVAAYAAWQRGLGYSGTDADGMPGMTSLKALGSQTGIYTVTA